MTNASVIVDLIRILLKKHDDKHGVLVMCKTPEVAMEIMDLLSEEEIARVRLQCAEVEENNA